MGESCDEKLQVPGPKPCDSLHALAFLHYGFALSRSSDGA